MERAGTTGVDAAVPMVGSSARLACDGDGEEEDDDDKSWYDTYNMTGDGEKKKKRERRKREREERDTPTGTVLFDQLIRQTVRQSAVQIVMPYLTLPYLTCTYLTYYYHHAITRYYLLLSVSSRLQCGGVYILDTLSFQHVRVRCLVRRSYGHPTDKD